MWDGKLSQECKGQDYDGGIQYVFQEIFSPSLGNVEEPHIGTQTEWSQLQPITDSDI